MKKFFIAAAVIFSVSAGIISNANATAEPCSGCTPPGPECCVADGVYLGTRGGSTPPPVQTASAFN